MKTLLTCLIFGSVAAAQQCPNCPPQAPPMQQQAAPVRVMKYDSLGRLQSVTEYPVPLQAPQPVQVAAPVMLQAAPMAAPVMVAVSSAPRAARVERFGLLGLRRRVVYDDGTAVQYGPLGGVRSVSRPKSSVQLVPVQMVPQQQQQPPTVLIIPR